MLLDGVERDTPRSPTHGADRRQRRRPRLLPWPTTTSCGRIAGEVLGSLDTLERYNLVDDAWNEVVAGRLAAADFLSFVEGFGGERSSPCGRRSCSACAASVGPRRRLPAVPGPRPCAAGAGGRRARRPGRRRGRPAGQAARPARRGVRRGRRRRRCRPRRGVYDQAEESSGSVDAELVAAATSIVAATGDEAMYERLLAGYREAANPQEQLRHLNVQRVRPPS